MSEAIEKPSKKERKRAEIVALAKDIFFREGYAGTSMAQVAARVGGSKATLYYHFPSKEALFLAVVDSANTGARPPEGEGGPSPDDFGEGEAGFRAFLRRFGCAQVARLTSPEMIALQRLAAGEGGRMPEVGRACYERGANLAFTRFAILFEAAMARGLIRRADPRLAAEQFVEMCTGWPMRRAVWGVAPPPDEAQIAAHVDAAVTAFLDGYGVR